MDKNTYRHAAYQMIRLVRCALTDRIPDREWAKSLDLSVLFAVCEDHILTACAAYALESAGIHDPDFTEAKAKAIRKNILLDAERKAILARLEQSKNLVYAAEGRIAEGLVSEARNAADVGQ